MLRVQPTPYSLPPAARPPEGLRCSAAADGVRLPGPSAPDGLRLSATNEPPRLPGASAPAGNSMRQRQTTRH